jgi:hypothetical protein
LFAVIPDDNIEEQTAKVIESDDTYDSIIVRLKRYIVNARSSGSGGSSSDNTSARIQLPTIPLPRLNDDIGEWVDICDKFTSLWNALKNYCQSSKYKMKAEIKMANIFIK